MLTNSKKSFNPTSVFSSIYENWIEKLSKSEYVIVIFIAKYILRSCEKWVAISYDDFIKGVAFNGKMLAEPCPINRSSIRTALKKLEQKELIIIHRHVIQSRKQKNIFAINFNLLIGNPMSHLKISKKRQQKYAENLLKNSQKLPPKKEKNKPFLGEKSDFGRLKSSRSVLSIKDRLKDDFNVSLSLREKKLKNPHRETASRRLPRSARAPVPVAQQDRDASLEELVEKVKSESRAKRKARIKSAFATSSPAAADSFELDPNPPSPLPRDMTNEYDGGGDGEIEKKDSGEIKITAQLLRDLWAEIFEELNPGISYPVLTIKEVAMFKRALAAHKLPMPLPDFLRWCVDNWEQIRQGPMCWTGRHAYIHMPEGPVLSFIGRFFKHFVAALSANQFINKRTPAQKASGDAIENNKLWNENGIIKAELARERWMRSEIERRSNNYLKSGAALRKELDAARRRIEDLLPERERSRTRSTEEMQRIYREENPADALPEWNEEDS